MEGIAYRAGCLYLADTTPLRPTPVTVRWRGQFCRWDADRYRPVSDETVQSDLTRWLARNVQARTEPGKPARPVTASLVRDAMHAVRSESAVPDEQQPGTWIRNPPPGALGPFLTTPGGVLDLGRLDEGGAALLPAGPDFFALAALPVTPDPTAGCARWLRFLEETFPGDSAAADRLQELFGYCLLPDCRFEKLFILCGDAYTGKSTVGEVLLALLGRENVGSLPLERLGEQFALASLTGKLATIIFDANEADRAAEGTLKALASGEPVTVEQKHAPVTTARLIRNPRAPAGREAVRSGLQ